MSETRTPEEEAIVKLEAQNARLRSDLTALVPLARTGIRLWIDSGYTGDLKMLDGAQRALAAYDQGGSVTDNVNPAPRTVTEERWVPWNTTHRVASLGVLCRTEIDAKRRCAWDEVPIRVMLTYTVPEGR